MSARSRLVPPSLATICLAAFAVILALMAASPQEGGSLDDRTRAVGATLKCPVCHDLSVAYSPAPVAQEMRATIRSELQAGESPEQIRQGFVDSYGSWILLTPTPRGFDLSLWAAPALVAVMALLVLVISIRRWSLAGHVAAGPTGSISGEDRELLEQAIAGIGSE